MRVTKFGTEISQASNDGYNPAWLLTVTGSWGLNKAYTCTIRTRGATNGFEAVGTFRTSALGATSTALSALLSTANLGTPELTIAYPGNTAMIAEWYWGGAAIGTMQLAGVGDTGSVQVNLSGDYGRSASTYMDNTVVDTTTGGIAITWDTTADLQKYWPSYPGYNPVGDVISGRLRSKLPEYYVALSMVDIVVPYLGGCVLVASPGKPLWMYRTRSSGITEAAGGLFGQADPLEAGQTNILTGDSYGLCHAWMTDQGHRALVYEHSGNLSAALWDGDWQPMLVQAARTKPWAIRLEPSNDVWIPCIDTSNNLKIDRLVWDGTASTYSVSTTELDTGIDAKDVGGMWIEPNGEVGLAYVNMSDQLAIATGDLSGGSWVL